MKIFLWAILILVIIMLGYTAYLWIVAPETTLEPQTITVTGTQVCLPHTDTSGPQTLECAFGLETDDGLYYALDTTAVGIGDHATGDRLEVSGTMTTREVLEEDDRLLQYDIEGVIHVARVTTVEADEMNRHILPGGAVQFEVPADFGLAVTAEQVLVESTVPPCADGFDYCLYYNEPRFEQTNFESAGLRVVVRDDLGTEALCLNTQPAGYTSLTPETNEADTYATSVFTPVEDAGAGHSATGAVYRLHHADTCYELETRIAVTQFGNHEPGTVTEFTATDRELLENKLSDLLDNVRLTEADTQQIF